MLKLLRYFKKREWLCLVGALVFIVLKVFFTLMMPDYMATLAKIAEGESGTMAGIWVNGGLMLSCALGVSICTIIVMIFTTRIAADFSARLREMIYRKVQGFSLTEINRFSTSSLITRTTNDIQQVQILITLGLDMFFRAPITVLWVIFRISTKRWQWSAALGIAVTIMVVGILLIMILVRKRVKKLQTLTDELNHSTRDNLSGIRVVRAYNAEGYQEEKFAQINDEFTKTNLFTSRTLAFMSPLMSLVMNGINLAIYWIGAYLINGVSTEEFMVLYSDMLIFISYGMVVVSSFTLLTLAFTVAPRALASVRRINEVLETEESIKDGAGVGETSETGTIEFRDVSFRYADGKEDVLSDISFKVNKGEVVALVGATGCGKSSVINLVTRLYDASSGEVLVDGHNVKEYGKDELAKKLGYVPQKAILFNGTIRDNVDFGDNGADEEEVEKALAIAQCVFVEEKEGGLEASVAQNGTNFSGGQKQRLSVARALTRDPEIYLFDDCFASLDYRTDKQLREAFNREKKGATCLMVSNRIGSLMEADKIIVLEDGRILGEGNHEELLSSCPAYREIALSQLKKEELR